jgi:glucose uptake protein GlcU
MVLSIGYIAAIVSCLSFGSFAVPIKGRIANEVNIDPLVMQTYKTALCFLTCWLVLLLPNVHFSFTYWGLLSGVAWIPGGTAGIYAVRNAGLAVSQGTWSALKVAVAFVWGIGVFHECVRSKTAATAAIIMLMMGLWGMSFFSSLRPRRTRSDNRQEDDDDEEYSEMEQPLLPEGDEDDTESTNRRVIIQRSGDGPITDDDEEDSPRIPVEDDELSDLTFDDGMANLRCCKMRRRTLGLICACIDGIWGGSILVPMHFAGPKTEGLGYVISFAIGASAVLIGMWILRIASSAVTLRSLQEAVRKLPPLHLRKFWLQGCSAGLLWSIGNVCSILSVEHLGEGVGYSIVQAQMLVAGLWGVLWYREVQGWQAVAGWFLCALTTLCGILLLSHEHLKTANTFNTVN